MATDLRRVFDDLIRFETDLWNGIDVRLQGDCGISLGSFNALLVIDAAPSCRVYDLATALSITVGGASQAVDRLETRGLCVRRPNPGDRRSSIVELTPAGSELVGTAGEIFDEELRLWLGGTLNAKALAGFGDALSGLRAAGRARRKADPRRAAMTHTRSMR